MTIIANASKLCVSAISLTLMVSSSALAHDPKVESVKAVEAAPVSREQAESVEKAVVKKKNAAKPKKITDRNHPDYRRCRSEPIIGSLARKRRVCMTNREWKLANNAGNRESRQLVEDMQVGLNGSN